MIVEFGEARLPRRFWQKVRAHQNGCWSWLGHVGRDGYGGFQWEGLWQLAHRVSFAVLKGNLPAYGKGEELDHLCRVRSCVNPAHLEVVSKRENVIRGVGLPAINAAKTHCKRGHPLTGPNLIVWRGGRQCRECHRVEQSKSRRRSKAVA